MKLNISYFILFACLLTQVHAFTLEEADINAIHTAIQRKEITCEQLVNQYIERIKKYNLNSDSPSINAITQINPTAIDAARNLDRYYQNTQQFKGKLHCIPVILKDNIDTFETLTTAGSYSMLGNQPIVDAPLVKAMRTAGAIFIAKGGMDEFSSNMIGISSRSGRIGNSYDANKNPGGSSGGPAAAVSANFATIGIGTDNSGSVRIPAIFNGLVGLRPSTDLVSQNGIFPMGNLDGVAGPITKNVSDLAKVLTIIAQENRTHGLDYTTFLNADALQGKRLAIVRYVGKLDLFREMPNEIKTIFRDAIKTLETLGATIVEMNLPNFDNNRLLNEGGEIEDVNHYLSSFAATRRNFRDICLSERSKTFGDTQSCLKFIHNVAKHNSDDYLKVKKMFEKNRHYVEGIMTQQKIDALIAPVSTKGSATYDVLSVNTWRGPIASNSGLPAIAFPIGYDSEHMPVGWELIGKQFEEEILISFAYAFEKKRGARIPPQLSSSNTSLQNISIAQMNNLFTQIGAASYEKILKNVKHNDYWYEVLTAEKFQKIVQAEMRMALNELE